VRALAVTDTDPRVELIHKCLSYPPIYPERVLALTALASLAAELRDVKAGSSPVSSTARAEAS